MVDVKIEWEKLYNEAAASTRSWKKSYIEMRTMYMTAVKLHKKAFAETQEILQDYRNVVEQQAATIERLLQELNS